VIFDTGQPHGVIRRDSGGFDATQFPDNQDFVQIFLTWELPIEDQRVASALEIAFDVIASAALPVDEEQLWVNGAPAILCPDSGRWREAG